MMAASAVAGAAVHMPARVPAPARPEADDASAAAKSDRSTLTIAATTTALGGGIIKGLLVDRPRIVMAWPFARDAGLRTKWAAELLTGQATHDVVPIAGGVMRFGAKTITTNAWRHAYQLSTGLSLALVAVGMSYGIPNIVDGLNSGEGGPKGLLESKPGRTGVAASIGGLLELGLFTTAFSRAPGSSTRMLNALHDPIHSSTAAVAAKLLVGVPVVLNEMGFLDFLNAGDERGIWETARDTVADKIDGARGLFD